MDYLDSLRGIAVLGVVMVHASIGADGFLKMYTPLRWIAFTGQRGVALFFVVSAFTLFLSFDHRRHDHRPVVNFFLRRWFRLAPMFYLAIAITRAYIPKFAGTVGQNVLAVFFLHGLSPAAIGVSAVGSWSIADEALFYLCLPFLFSQIKTLRASVEWLILGSFFGFVLQVLLTLHSPQNGEFFQFLSISAEFPVFLQGICAYFIWKEKILVVESLSHRRQISVLLLLAAVLLYTLLLPFSNWKLYPSTVVCMLLLLALSSFPWPFFVNRVTRFLGKISYSVYLLHFTVVIWLQKRTAELIITHPQWNMPHAQFVASFAIVLLFTIPVATATWRWIEEPGVAAGRRVIAYFEAHSMQQQFQSKEPVQAELR